MTASNTTVIKNLKKEILELKLQRIMVNDELIQKLHENNELKQKIIDLYTEMNLRSGYSPLKMGKGGKNE